MAEHHGEPVTSLLKLKDLLRTLSRAERRAFQLEPATLATAYCEQRASAPRRGQGYLSPTRKGVTSSGDCSNRTEEHLAIGLFLQGELGLPSGESLKLFDYQFPLKAVRADAGIGKVDLLGLYQDGTLAVVELKIAGNAEDRRIALLEGLIYAAVIEANVERIAAEIEATRNVRVTRAGPRIVVVGPPLYWSEANVFPQLAEFEALTVKVAEAIGIDIVLLCLQDADGLVFGRNGCPPQLHGQASLSLVPNDTKALVSRAIDTKASARVRRGPPAVYADDLHRRFWDYRRTAFVAGDECFDPVHAEGSAPPVFRRECAARNVLLPPGAAPDTRAAIVAMVRAEDRHRWFTSMKSSQALAQSVFASLAAMGRLAALEGLAADDGRPAFFLDAASYRLTLEHQVSTLGEPSPTSLDVLIDGPQRIAVEVKFAEKGFGRCSRPNLKPGDRGYTRDFCDGSYSVQRDRRTRCSLLERGILYWKFVPDLFTWSASQDHRPCPLDVSYQLVRNVLGVCVGEDGVLDPGSGHVLVVYDSRNPAFQAGGAGDAAWNEMARALRFPHLLRRLSWQSLAGHLRQFAELAWLTAALENKYGLK